MHKYTEVDHKNSHPQNKQGEVKRVGRLFYADGERLATRTFVLDRYSLRIKRIVGTDGTPTERREFVRFGGVGDIFGSLGSKIRTRTVHRTDSSAEAVLAGAAAGILIGSMFSK